MRTKKENNIQIEQNPIANNETDSEDSEISDIDLEINGEEQIEPTNINLENIADPENLEFEDIESMAQNRMDLLTYSSTCPNLKMEAKIKTLQQNMYVHSKIT